MNKWMPFQEKYKLKAKKKANIFWSGLLTDFYILANLSKHVFAGYTRTHVRIYL